MKLTNLVRSILVAVCLFLVSASTAFAQEVCEHADLKRRPAIPFRPFPLENPTTGEKYLANQLVDVGGGKTMPAGEVFNQLNELERTLSEWGYTLRDGGTYTLEELVACVKLLDKQSDLISKNLSDATSWWELDERLSRLKDDFRAYQEKVPSLETLRRRADDPAVQVFLPEKPAFHSPTTEIPRLATPKNIKKERSWALDFGEKSKFYVGGSFGLSMEAGVTRASASANGALHGAILGKGTEIFGATAKGDVNEGSAASFHVDVRAVGQTVFKRDWRQDALELGDEWKFPVEKGMDFRFSIGPVPCRARVGFNGSLGVKYGIQVIPIEVGAHVTQFAGAKAFAQVGVDIGIAGAGVGGELTLIEETFRLTGTAGMSFDDELQLVVELTGSNELEALSGRLYAYAYLDLWIKRWEGRKTLWDWGGLKKRGEVFRFRTAWSPSGVTVDGDATIDDIREIDEQRGDIADAARVNSLAERERVIARLDHESGTRMHDLMDGVVEDLNGDATLHMRQEIARLEAADGALRNAIAQYWAEARRWGVAN